MEESNFSQDIAPGEREAFKAWMTRAKKAGQPRETPKLAGKNDSTIWRIVEARKDINPDSR